MDAQRNRWRRAAVGAAVLATVSLLVLPTRPPRADAAPASVAGGVAAPLPAGGVGPDERGRAAGSALRNSSAAETTPDGAAVGKTPDEAAPAGPGGPSTAAERFGWGSPLPGSDEFDYTGKPDPAKWSQAGQCWAGHAGNGRRCASNSVVDGSKLVQTGLANGDTGWLASKTDQRYGRWEARVRSVGSGPATGRQYHPLLIVWPSSNRWPQDGEYDFLENGAPGQQCAESYIHYPQDGGVSVQQIFAKETSCGAPMTAWHNVAFEWTPDYVAGFIDGRQWFRYSGGATGVRNNIQDMPSGHLTIQLDNFYGSRMQPARYEVDWARIYTLNPAQTTSR